MNTQAPSISIAIFSARETPETLVSTVAAALAASAGMATRCDVIVNGPDGGLARALVRDLQDRRLDEGTTVRVFHIPVADKAYCWNHYVHDLWPGAAFAFFIDGYAQVTPDALASLCRRMSGDPEILGGTGVPTQGRSAGKMRDAMLRDGGIHGNLYAIKGAAMGLMRDLGFRLPLGIYRTDPTVASVINFNLDPARNSWNSRRITVDPGATWTFSTLSVWRPRDIRTYLKRTLRQAQGVLENRAVRQHLAIDKHTPRSLPSSNHELVTGWAAAHAGEARRIFMRQPLVYYAFRKLRPWPGDPASAPAGTLVAQFGGCTAPRSTAP